MSVSTTASTAPCASFDATTLLCKFPTAVFIRININSDEFHTSCICDALDKWFNYLLWMWDGELRDVYGLFNDKDPKNKLFYDYVFDCCISQGVAFGQTDVMLLADCFMQMADMVHTHRLTLAHHAPPWCNVPYRCPYRVKVVSYSQTHMNLVLMLRKEMIDLDAPIDPKELEDSSAKNQLLDGDTRYFNAAIFSDLVDVVLDPPILEMLDESIDFFINEQVREMNEAKEP